MRFTERRGVCPTDGIQKPTGWLHEPMPPCPVCGGPLDPSARVQRFDAAAFVIGDEIDTTIADGVCHPDGTPRRFRSRTELRQAEQAAGLRRLEPGEKFAGDERAKARAEARRSAAR